MGGSIKLVFHEVICDLVHVDLHWVLPTSERPFNTLVTTGMATRAMAVPAGAEHLAFAELAINLPQDWPMRQESWQNEANYWPIRLLKILARMPHEYNTWLCSGHTVEANPDGSPYHSSTTFTGALLTAAIAAATALLVTGLTNYLTKVRERESEWRRLKLERYREYVAARWPARNAMEVTE